MVFQVEGNKKVLREVENYEDMINTSIVPNTSTAYRKEAFSASRPFCSP